MTMLPPDGAREGASGFQYVPVPIEHLPAVYRLLSDLVTGTASAAQAAQAAPAAPVATPAASSTGSWQSDRIDATFAKADEAWTVPQLKQLAAGSYTSTEALSEILDVIALNPEWYSQEQLAEATGRSLDQYRIVWSKLTPHFEKHYGTGLWPLIGFAGTQLTPPRQSSLIHFTTTPTIIERWKQVRGL
jgi:hypothetical protein